MDRGLTGRDRIGRLGSPGDEEGYFEKARKQHVREAVDHILTNAPGERDRSESCLQAPKAMAAVDFAPLLPSDDGVSVDQNDLPHLLAVGQFQEGIERGLKCLDRVRDVRGGPGRRGSTLLWHAFRDVSLTDRLTVCH